MLMLDDNDEGEKDASPFDDLSRPPSWGGHDEFLTYKYLASVWG